ncbi:MAG TPA: hypothetical protein VH020_13980 [Stellaceae bacterium]|jgi:hypothetical protein|nr:hypothetical protein [Stellaceae bacterium]
MLESPADAGPTTANQGRIGPYSRLLARGAVSGRTREGKFLRAVEAQLAEHVGGSPSLPQRMLISRLARVALRLELFDEKMANGKTTDLDARVYGGLHNSFRLLLRELGLKATAAKPPTLAEIAEKITASKRESAAA